MDLVTFSTAATLAKNSFNVIKTIADLSKDAEINGKIIELQQIILSLQEQISVLRNDHQNLIQAKREVEEKLETYINKKEEKDKYEKFKFPTNAIGIRIKSPQDEMEKSIWYCAQCFENDEISILQPTKKYYHKCLLNEKHIIQTSIKKAGINSW